MRIRHITATILAVLSVSILALPALAQESDVEGCKDHPLFTRMRNYVIQECETKDFDEAEFYIQDEEPKIAEGRKTRIEYVVKEGLTPATYLQIRRNYGNAVKSLSGTIHYDDQNMLSAQILKSGREFWMQIDCHGDGESYSLTVVEVEAMVQEVSANEMLEALNKDGYIALYISFDSGKAELKPEAEGTIGQIIALLTENPDLKVGIEGHTDNVGIPAANKTLSEQRAKAVMAAVVAGGVDAARLVAVGWGQEKPVADNRGEEGRAKNRRVEVVKK